ncbi:MAG: AI-2E family transporter [Anaerolineae bacterium]|nr:AI-2E family transporter [Anaerolineae bacterium]
MNSKPWSESTKRWAIVGLVVAGAALLLRVRGLLPPVILACLLTYLLNPVVEWFMALRLSRTRATVVTYLILIAALVLTAFLLVPLVVQQISSINVDLEEISLGVLGIMGRYQTITILDYSIELSELFHALQDSLLQLITSFASRSAQEMLGIAFGVASGFVSTFVWLVFILVVAFWLLKDADELTRPLQALVPVDYRDEVTALTRKVGEVWDSFFRGLLLLSFTVGAVTTVLMWLVGVRNALLLGILAGVLEVVPSIGPIVACIPAVAVAYFQGSTHLPLAQGWFALLVLTLYVGIQQVENNFLAPRILGGSVRLHPVVVLVGAIGGYAVGGIFGAFLAAPVIGTFKVFGQYLYRKLTEVQATIPPASEVQPSASADLSAEDEADTGEQGSATS